MGWTYSYTWESQKDVESRLIQNLPDGYKSLGTSSRFGEFYAAIKRPDGGVFIMVCLIKGNKREWGYKDMSEDVEPFFYNCPEKLLKLSTMMDGGSQRWRAKCRKLRADKNAAKRILSYAKQSDIIKTRFGDVRFQYPIGKSLSSFAGYSIDKQQLYKYSVNDIVVGD